MHAAASCARAALLRAAWRPRARGITACAAMAESSGAAARPALLRLQRPLRVAVLNSPGKCVTR
jgi:hypothetical protein